MRARKAAPIIAIAGDRETSNLGYIHARRTQSVQVSTRLSLYRAGLNPEQASLRKFMTVTSPRSSRKAPGLSLPWRHRVLDVEDESTQRTIPAARTCAAAMRLNRAVEMIDDAKTENFGGDGCRYARDDVSELSEKLKPVGYALPQAVAGSHNPNASR